MRHTEVGTRGFRGHLNVFNHHDDILAGLLNRTERTGLHPTCLSNVPRDCLANVCVRDPTYNLRTYSLSHLTYRLVYFCIVLYTVIFIKEFNFLNCKLRKRYGSAWGVVGPWGKVVSPSLGVQTTKKHTYIACMCKRCIYGHSVHLCVYLLTTYIKASNLNRNF